MKSLFLILVTSDIHQVTPTELVGVVISILSVSAIFITSFITFHPNHRDAIESHRYHLIDHDREVRKRLGVTP